MTGAPIPHGAARAAIAAAIDALAAATHLPIPAHQARARAACAALARLRMPQDLAAAHAGRIAHALVGTHNSALLAAVLDDLRPLLAHCTPRDLLGVMGHNALSTPAAGAVLAACCGDTAQALDGFGRAMIALCSNTAISTRRENASLCALARHLLAQEDLGTVAPAQGALLATTRAHGMRALAPAPGYGACAARRDLMDIDALLARAIPDESWRVAAQVDGYSPLMVAVVYAIAPTPTVVATLKDSHPELPHPYAGLTSTHAILHLLANRFAPRELLWGKMPHVQERILMDALAGHDEPTPSRG